MTTPSVSASKAPADLLFRLGGERLWVQDCPVLPGVWRAFMDDPGSPVDLIITPHRDTRPASLAAALRERLGSDAPGVGPDAAIAFNQTGVVARVSFPQLIECVAPMSAWHQRLIAEHGGTIADYRKLTRRSGALKSLARAMLDATHEPEQTPRTLVWWLRAIGLTSIATRDRAARATPEAFDVLDEGLAFGWPDPPPRGSPRLHRIGVNRATEPACVDAVRTIKGDAATRLFEADTSRVCWAVLDSGVDKRHPSFLSAPDGADDAPRSRVIETWDFTRIRRLINLASTPGNDAERALRDEFSLSQRDARRIRTSLATGGDVDWDALRPALCVTDDQLDAYAGELNPHGTHVAGIIGGRAQTGVGEREEDCVGVCPDIKLVDVRILGPIGESGRAGKHDREFEIIAALQFIRHRNSVGDHPTIHGVNLSVQLLHDPAEFACGSTPVCQECDRLVANGVVVVAAAGNMGVAAGGAAATTFEGAYRDISISDPGNAAGVITVGSTHRKRPHEYGVSFFSGRGPTGDGRAKPDLVAPGERILAPIPNGAYRAMSGTSQAAPYVSGAAALLLARHSELIGQPERIKQILCDTATDLGRYRDFQGAGLVDALRAMQSM